MLLYVRLYFGGSRGGPRRFARLTSSILFLPFVFREVEALGKSSTLLDATWIGSPSYGRSCGFFMTQSAAETLLRGHRSTSGVCTSRESY